MCRCISSYHWAFDARGIIGGDGMWWASDGDIKEKKLRFWLEASLCSDCTGAGAFEISCPAGVLGHKWHQHEGMCFCLPSIHYIIEWSCMCSEFIRLNPPTGSESARTGQLWWGGFLIFPSFCWVTCPLKMWKVWSISEPTKDSTQCNDAVIACMYLHHLQSDWLFFSARTLEGLSLSHSALLMHWGV